MKLVSIDLKDALTAGKSTSLTTGLNRTSQRETEGSATETTTGEINMRKDVTIETNEDTRIHQNSSLRNQTKSPRELKRSLK